MSENQIDANMPGPGQEAASSAADTTVTDDGYTESPSPIMDDDGLVSTVEYKIPQADTSSDGAEQNTPPETSEAKEDFHKHARFQELVSQKNEAKQTVEELQKKIADLEKKIVPYQTPDGKKGGQKRFEYTPIKQMTAEEIVEKFTENPHEIFETFARNLSDDLLNYIEASKHMEMQQHQQTMAQSQFQTELRSFFDARPDAQQMLVSGHIQDFMARNPGHNPFSAYYALTGGQQAQAVDPEVIRQEERKKLASEMKAKGFARSTSSGRADTGKNYDPANAPELRNPEKYGGRNNVLLERMKARAAGGF